MSDLDQISAAIGALQQAQVDAAAQRERIFEQLEKIGASTAGLPALHDRVAAMAPEVEDYKRLKQRGIGILTTVAFGASLLTAVAKALQEKIWP